MNLKRTIAVGALAALAVGGLDVGTAVATPASSGPAAGVTPVAVGYTTPLTVDKPGNKTEKGGEHSDKGDSEKGGEHSDKRDSDKRDSDNVQHEGSGEEGR